MQNSGRIDSFQGHLLWKKDNCWFIPLSSFQTNRLNHAWDLFQITFDLTVLHSYNFIFYILLAKGEMLLSRQSSIDFFRFSFNITNYQHNFPGYSEKFIWQDFSCFVLFYPELPKQLLHEIQEAHFEYWELKLLYRPSVLERDPKFRYGYRSLYFKFEFVLLPGILIMHIKISTNWAITFQFQYMSKYSNSAKY